MTANKLDKRLKVAIIGGGPAGLGTAIDLAKLPFVDWKLYEKRPRVDETVGGGISLQQQTWRLLELNGTAQNISPKDFYRPPDSQHEQRRNGRSGKLLLKTYHPDAIPLHRRSCRLVRTKLQAALLKNVDETRLCLGRKLIGIEHTSNNRVRISFNDGFMDEVDLLIGADGVGSLVRQFSFPDHTLHYNGQSGYRTIISKAKAQEIDGIPWVPVFWKHKSGLYVFTCPLGNDDFEVTARIRRPKARQEYASWGRPFDFRTLLHEYDDFCLPIRQILRLAAEGDTREFDFRSGPHLQNVVACGNIALIGDASHPLSGNFGAGVGFALEDVYALTKVLNWAWSKTKPLAYALELFDAIRSPHYKAVYEVMDKFTTIKSNLLAEGLLVDEEIEERIKRISDAAEWWMYSYEIDIVVAETFREVDEMRK